MRALLLSLFACLLVVFTSGGRVSSTNKVLAARWNPEESRNDREKQQQEQEKKSQDSGANAKHKPTHLDIGTGTLVSATGAPIQLRAFHALIIDGGPQDKSGVQDDDGRKKVVTVTSGSAFLTNASLGQLLTAKLAGHDLEDIKVVTEGGKVKISGKAKKTVSMPFSVEGPVSLTQQGFIRLQTDTIKVAKLPGLASLLGVTPEKLAPDGQVKGVSTQKDAITFDPDLLWGLPVHGRVARVAVEKSGLLLVFGGTPPGPRPSHYASRSRPGNKQAAKK